MDFLPSAFSAMASVSQFIIYSLVPSKTRPGKTDKFPVDYRSGKISNAHDPAIWLSAELAVATAKAYGAGYGVGFVFTAADPFWFLDIDDCLEPCGTKWSPLAIQLLTTLQGAAVEISASGRGLHIIGSGVVPPHACRNAQHKLEFYTAERFIALTGTHAGGSSDFDASAILPSIIDQYFKPGTSTANPDNWTTEAVPEWSGNADDAELIARAIRSQSSASAFGGGVSFRDLWDGNREALARAYPDTNRECGYDESAADAGLAQRLAFWTGNNCERIRRLMLQSALNREKWNRVDYLPRTILGACGRQREVLSDKTHLSTNPATCQESGERLRPTVTTGSTFLTIDQQIAMFEGCVYVSEEHRILIPGGYLLNNERFKVTFGGFSFPMDHGNERVSRNAFEAFTESQAFRAPRADSSCFRPDINPGAIITKDGQTLANVYWPVATPRIAGDPAPFLRHVEKLFPDPRDQAIILAYLAAIVQYKGIKFQWAPLLQGVEGNGKTFFTRCVAFAIGDRYSHFPKAAEIAAKFNGWLYGKIFIGVEDIYLFDSKFEVMETLKPMITGERQEIEAKGSDKITRDICANFLINTNHKDGLRKTRNDRRFAPFYTAQQSLADLKRDGMLGDYFPDLYNWAAKRTGYAIISEYLHTYPIPDEFNPATQCNRAPNTSSTEAAIEEGRGKVEQEIIEATEQGQAGFKGGWVSSIMLDRLLAKINSTSRVPPNKRRELMQSLGYDWHPGLKDGRTNDPVLPDSGKSRLYIKHDHKDRALTGGGVIAKAYVDAQK